MNARQVRWSSSVERHLVKFGKRASAELDERTLRRAFPIPETPFLRTACKGGELTMRGCVDATGNALFDGIHTPANRQLSSFTRCA